MRLRLAVVALTVLLVACRPAQEPVWSGYAEGEYVYVAAPLAGTLTALEVRAGEQVTRGKPLFVLEAQAEQAARAEAQARLAAARYQAANADKARRPPEIAMQQAQVAQARAQLELARQDFARKSSLVKDGMITRADYDAARTALADAQGKLASAEAALRLALLPSRIDERAAADAQVEAARQVLKQSEWREQQKQQAAPADGVVSDTFFRPGEFVQAGQPVVSLLPPGYIKARFYVAEGELASVALGQAVRLSCDRCGAPIEARVSFIAAQPEYTPPVIYSNAQRSKLVFLVEARPVSLADGARLHPGQPLDVRPVAARKS